jgi:tetratricopeptide (TPR) repeat protein
MTESAISPSISLARLTLAGQVPIEGVPGPEPVQMHTAARDTQGRLYLSDEFNHRVIVLDSSGKCLNVVGKRGNGPGEFWYPRGLAVVEDGGAFLLVVCDAWNHRIQVFDLGKEGFETRPSAFGSIGEGEDQFNEPCVVLPDGNGRVWILDRCNHRLKLCSLDGKTLKIIGRRMTIRDEDKLNDPVWAYIPIESEPPPLRGFCYPTSAVRLDNGDFLIADTNNGRLARMTQDGVATQIVNLKGETAPFFHPVWVGNMGGGLAAVRGVTGPFRLIDLAHPWNEAVLDIAQGSPLLTDEPGAVTAVDLRKKLVSRYLMNAERSAEPPPAMIETSAVNPSRAWADRIGEFWFTYLSEAPESGTTGDMASRFAAVCRTQAVEAGNRLSEVESDYLKKAVEYQLLVELIKKEKSEKGAPSAQTRSALNWQVALLRRAEAQRGELRRILFRNLMWSIRLFDKTTSGFKDKYLAGEIAGLRKILQDERAARTEDYRRVVDWLKESVSKPTPPSFATLFNACIGAVFLHEHMRYLKRTLKTLQGTQEEREPLEGLPWSISICGGIDVALLAEWLFFALGFLCRQWGRHESAIEAYERGVAMDARERQNYEIQVCVTMLMAGDVDQAVKRLASMAPHAVAETQTQLMIGSVFAEYGRDVEALECFRRALAGLAPENPLCVTVKKAEIRALQNTGSADEALKIIGEMEKTFPGSAQVYLLRGDVLGDSLRSGEALSSYQKAKESGAGLEADLRIGNTHLAQGEFKKAMKVFGDVIADPRLCGMRVVYEQAEFGLVRCLLMKGETDKALDLLDSREFTAFYLQASMTRCGILRVMGRLEESTANFKRLAELYPETRGIHGGLALSLALSGDENGSDRAIDLEEKRFPGSSARRLKGIILRILGKASGSLRELGDRRWVSTLSPMIALERVISAAELGDEKEIGVAVDGLLEISGRAEAWNGFVFSREDRSPALENALSLAENSLRGAGKKMRYERRGPVTLWYMVK